MSGSILLLVFLFHFAFDGQDVTGHVDLYILRPHARQNNPYHDIVIGLVKIDGR